MQNTSSSSTSSTPVTTSSTPVVYESTLAKPEMPFGKWNPRAFKFMPPKLNKSGGKMITMLSQQTGKAHRILIPACSTFGIQDFKEKANDGTSLDGDGKYTITLQLHNHPEVVAKIKEFEDALIDAYVTNSQLWTGKAQTRDIGIFSFNSSIKYPKVDLVEGSGKKDGLNFERPMIKCKVAHDVDTQAWKVNIFDIPNGNKQIWKDGDVTYMNEDGETISPVTLVPAKSSVAVLMQSSGVWTGGKGWGHSWKVPMIRVEPPKQSSANGACFDENGNEIDIGDEQQCSNNIAVATVVAKLNSTHTEDSDDDEAYSSKRKRDDEEKEGDDNDNNEEDTKKTRVEEKQPDPVPVVVAATPAPIATKKLIKKVVTGDSTAAPVAVAVPVATATPAVVDAPPKPKIKIMKPKVAAV